MLFCTEGGGGGGRAILHKINRPTYGLIYVGVSGWGGVSLSKEKLLVQCLAQLTYWQDKARQTKKMELKY